MDTDATTTPRRERLPWADVAKGLSIFLVVLHHLVYKHYPAVLPTGLAHWGHAWATVSWTLKPVRMPLFFLVSGFFCAGAVHRPWPQVRAKVLTPYYLYAVWLVLLAAFYLLETRTPAHRVHSARDLAEQLVLPATSMWFLWGLAAYFLLARLLRGLPHVPVVAVAAAVSSSVSLWGIEDNNRVAVLSHSVFFLVGAYFPGLVRRVAEARVPMARLAVAFAAATGLLLAAGAPLTARVVVLGVLSLPLGLAVARRLAATPAGPVLGWLGRHTLPVYVLHLFVLGALAHLPLRFGAEPDLLAGLTLAAYPLLVAALVTATCLGLHRVLLALGLRPLFSAPAWLVGPGPAPLLPSGLDRLRRLADDGVGRDVVGVDRL